MASDIQRQLNAMEAQAAALERIADALEAIASQIQTEALDVRIVNDTTEPIPVDAGES